MPLRCAGSRLRFGRRPAHAAHAQSLASVITTTTAQDQHHGADVVALKRSAEQMCPAHRDTG